MEFPCPAPNVKRDPVEEKAGCLLNNTDHREDVCAHRVPVFNVLDIKARFKEEKKCPKT